MNAKPAVEISACSIDQFRQVQNLYWTMIDDMQSSPYKPGWQKHIYPSDVFLIRSLENRQLYMLKVNGNPAGAMVLNHESNDSYPTSCWQVKAKDEEVLLIHALGILPEYQNQGYARKMVEEAIRIAGQKGMKAIRIDVLEGNEPAAALYRNMGFTWRDTARMYYEDTGWTNFHLFELLIPHPEKIS